LFASEGAAVGTGDGSLDVLTLGAAPGSEGTVTLVGPRTSGVIGRAIVGDQGQGLLTISHQAEVSVGGLTVGERSAADNRLTVQGATLRVGGDLTVGAAGNGMLSISAGGRVTSGPGLIASSIPTGGEGAVVVDGEGSVWEVLDSLVVGGDLFWPRGLGHLAVIRGGAVVVDEQLKVWPTSEVLLNQGTIQADRVDVLGTLQGAGTVAGDVTLGAGGVLSPGLQLAMPVGPGGPGGPNGPHQQGGGKDALALAALLDGFGGEADEISASSGLPARQLATVPEPSAWGLLLAALASLAMAGRASRRGFVRRRAALRPSIGP